MDGFAIFSGIKLFLEIIQDGPSAIAKGIIMSVIPGNTIIDIAETFGLFDLNGNYCGEVNVEGLTEVSMSNIRLLNEAELMTSLKQIDFPALAQLDFRKFQERTFPSFDGRKFPEF
jgi:hypothetical protein